MQMQVERRLFDSEFEVRSLATGFQIEGYAAKFGMRSQNIGFFVEQIRQGAFTRAIAENQDVRALFNHDPNMILGRTAAGTLRVSQDSTGLPYQLDLPDTTYARDLAESMQRGDVTQSSFGFRTVQDEWEDDGPDLLRTLIDVDLFDVSPVTYPAYLDTESGLVARSLTPSLVLEEYRSRQSKPPTAPQIVINVQRDYDADVFDVAMRARLLALHTQTGVRY